MITNLSTNNRKFLPPKVNTLFHALVHTSLATISSAEIDDYKQLLSSATELEWQQVIVDLELHRLVPLIFCSLKKHGIVDVIPPTYFKQLQSEYSRTYRHNTLLLLVLDKILLSMGKHDLHPILWKGAVLADSFYPNLGMRPMRDLDFAIDADEIDLVTKVFRDLAFVSEDSMKEEDAIYFANTTGILCDVHHRVRLFEGRSENLTIDLKPKQMSISTMRILEPNAMVVHLIVHLNGHAKTTGLELLWIVDLVYVFRRWGAKIQIEQIEKLMPDKESLVCLFRVIRFLETEFNEKFPFGISEAAKSFKPFTLAEILRNRRLALWGLPYPLGWLRLIAAKLGFKFRTSRPDLDRSDLFLGIADVF